MFIRAKTIFRIGSDLIWPGMTVDVDDWTGKSLCNRNAAEETAGIDAQLAPAPVSSGLPNGKRGEAENASEGQKTANNDVVDPESMSFAELKALAQSMGIEGVGKLKSKAALIAAISEADDEMPDLTPQDVVDE